MQIKTIATAAVAEKMQANKHFNDFVYSSLNRHFRSDWGEVSEDDSAANTSDPLYALSAYTNPDGAKIWVKQDYNIVTVLFPSEY
ncbi:hypothetical protein [Enterocloster asparagiformis]|uniref:hypothetical protein n=1 Tax=Enterocloster asparagiformis TaxID=333367 RepID=UPI000464B16E|nr:hypothetical protein [Enterocloster asparagiformis]